VVTLVIVESVYIFASPINNNMKKYNVTYSKNGLIVSDFQVTAKDLKDAKVFAQHGKNGFGRVQTYVRLAK
jgi:hypothetical protein